jgi:hypothetical protein
VSRMVSKAWWGVLVAVLAAAPAAAQQTDSAQVRRLQEQVEAITRELEELRLGKEVVVQADTGVVGFGPAASKVYKAAQGVSVGGYGEFLYNNFAGSRQDDAPSGLTDQIDALRAVLYVGYKFSDKVLFNSEVEFEHASTEDGGAVSVEFAYLDYRIKPTFGVRGGLLLAPMGLINEIHEPPTFLGALRPVTEQVVVPSTWSEVGLGVFGETPALSYRAYLMTGFDATGFEAEEGLREGRQGGAEAAAQNFAGVGRLDYTGVPGLTIGTSAYLGNAGQGATVPSDPTQTIGARTFIWDGHAEYRARGFDLRGLVAVATLKDAAEVNELNGLTGTESVGDRLLGWYLQGGYDVLRGHASGQQLIPYVRYEQVNTQDRVPDGFAADPANDRRIVTIGGMWKPLTNISVKADYQINHTEADTGVNQLNVNLGYLF